MALPGGACTMLVPRGWSVHRAPWGLAGTAGTVLMVAGDPGNVQERTLRQGDLQVSFTRGVTPARVLGLEAASPGSLRQSPESSLGWRDTESGSRL